MNGRHRAGDPDDAGTLPILAGVLDALRAERDALMYRSMPLDGAELRDRALHEYGIAVADVDHAVDSLRRARAARDVLSLERG